MLATLLVSIAGALVATHYARVALQRADAQERASYSAGLAAAVRALEQQDFAATRYWLDRLPAGLRGWEHDYLRARLVHHSAAWEAPEALASRPVFEPGGERARAFLADGSIGTWETASGRLLGRRAVAGIRADVEESMGGLSVHAASARYAALAADGGVLVGNLAGGAPERLAPLAPGGCTTLLAWDPAGRRLLYRGEETWLWDGERSERLTDATSFCADFNQAGDRVAVADRDLVRVYDVASGEELASTRLPDVARAVRFAPDGETLAYAGEYRNVLLLDGGTLEVLERLSGHAGRLDALSWSADGALLLSASSADATARAWDAGRGWQPRAFSLAGRPDARTRRPSLTSIAPDGTYFLAAGDGLERYPLAERGVLRGHETYVYCLAFSPDGSRLASAGYHTTEVFLWDVARAEPVARLEGPAPDGVGSLSAALELGFSADGGRLVALAAQEVGQWDARSGAPLPAPEAAASPTETFMAALGHRAWGPDRTCALSADESFVAVRVGPTRVALHTLEPGEARAAMEALPPAELLGRICEPYRQGAEPTGLLESPGGEVYCVAISPDGSRVATAGNDAAIRIWDRARCELLLVLRGHTQYVMDLAFSPDGSLLASASGDTTVRLWDTLPLHERLATGPAGTAARR